MSQAYDNAFRTMEMDCPQLLIPVVNEVFQKSYPPDTKVRMFPNEQMITTAEDEQSIRITDSNFMMFDNYPEQYHIECESNPRNKELIVRLYQYDVQVALQSRHYSNGVLHVRLPKTAVLYLRHGPKTPGELRMVIEDGAQKITRRIPIVKIQMYTLEELFEKRLLFFLPFHIFVHEKELSLYNRDESKRKLLMDEYRYILRRLVELEHSGEIDGMEKYCIITSMRNVLALLAKHKKQVLTEAEKIMGGEILEYEAKTIYRKGREDGIQQGLQKGDDAINVILADLIKSGKLSEEEAKAFGNKAKQELEK